MKQFVVFLLGLSLLACNNKPGTNDTTSDSLPPQADTTPDTTIYPPLSALGDTTPNKSAKADTLMNLVFEPDSSTLTAKGKLDKDPITCYLQVDRKAIITAKLVPLDKDLNIRFSQIILPDGTSDGPFGQELKYTLKQKGMHRFIVGSNLMADGKRKGDFEIKLAVKELK